MEKTTCVIPKAEIEILLVAEQKKEEEPEMENPPCHTLGWGITVEGLILSDFTWIPTCESSEFWYKKLRVVRPKR